MAVSGAFPRAGRKIATAAGLVRRERLMVLSCQTSKQRPKRSQAIPGRRLVSACICKADSRQYDVFWAPARCLRSRGAGWSRWTRPINGLRDREVARRFRPAGRCAPRDAGILAADRIEPQLQDGKALVFGRHDGLAPTWKGNLTRLIADSPVGIIKGLPAWPRMPPVCRCGCRRIIRVEPRGRVLDTVPATGDAAGRRWASGGAGCAGAIWTAASRRGSDVFQSTGAWAESGAGRPPRDACLIVDGARRGSQVHAASA